MKSSNTCLNSPLTRRAISYWLALAAVCLFGLIPLPIYAIDSYRAMSQYVRQRWGTESGFPKGPVYAISQTPDGYLWVGTEAGLLRFDGIRFELIKDNLASLNITSVLSLTPDKQGNLWLRLPLPRPTLLRYRQGKIENVMADFGIPQTTVAAMNVAQDGALLLWVLKGEGRAVIQRGNKFETIATPQRLSRSPVLAIAETSDGDLWIGTRDAGLYRLRGGHTEAITAGLPDLKVNCLLPTKSGELWVGTDRGITRWDGSKLTQAGLPKSLDNLQTLSLTLDRDGNIWVGTNSEGLLRLNIQGVASLDEGGQAVTAVFEDREGNLWVGSANGIERLRDSVFVSYSVPEGMPSEKNGPVYVDSTGRTWFAPIAGGLHWLKDGQHGRVTNAGLDRDAVYSLAGGADELWVGRKRGGLTRLQMRGTTVQAMTYTQANGLAQNSVYAVYRSRDGSVWAGTLSGGVSHLRHGKFTTYTLDDGLASNTVASILESADGTMWFATSDGLSALTGSRWRTYQAQDGLPVDNVSCLLEDAAGVLWAGTAKGLAYLSDGGFKRPAAAYASLQEPVLGMADDRNGSLWIATSNHVLRVARDKLMNGNLYDADVREFGLTDGLHGVEGVRRHRSVVTDSLGRIWFSLNRGLSVVSPGRLTIASAPPIVHVQTVSADGSLLSLADPLRIPAGRQRITFGFAGLGLAIPEQVKFRYRMDPFDPGWSAPSVTREAAYTNLRPGAYRFRVMATNADGFWNGAEAVINVRIEPLFWQTWWFWLACAVVVGLTVVAAYRFRLRQLTRQMNLQFEERLDERTRIAQELHDTLLQGFLSASMQLHVAAEQVAEDSPAKPRLSRVLQLMGQVVDEGRDALRGLRTTNDKSLNLEQAFVRVQQELALPEQIRFRVIVEGEPKCLHPIFRDEVYRIGREALVNAFRHSHAKSIEVEVEYAAKYLTVIVRDDGCGIDAQVLRSGRDGHFGLTSMRERAERIGARLAIASRAASGTEVKLSVPGGAAFAAQPGGRWRRWFVRLTKRSRR